MKKVLQVLLTITAPIWAIPMLFVLLVVIVFVEAYEDIGKTLDRVFKDET